MKLLRVGQKGKEKPAVLDPDGKIKDISSNISDLNPDNLNFKTISKIKNLDLSCFTGSYVTGTVTDEYLSWVENNSTS